MKTVQQTNEQDLIINLPVTEEDGFRILDEIYPLQEKLEAIKMTKDEFAINEHFGLGMWIRNNWIYCPETDNTALKERYDACYSMLTGTKPGELRFLMDDMVAGDFLEKYYDHLKATVKVDDPAK